MLHQAACEALPDSYRKIGAKSAWSARFVKAEAVFAKVSCWREQ
jgi:hypothetical protein